MLRRTQCIDCKHIIVKRSRSKGIKESKCSAFPNGIPGVVRQGSVLHDEILENQEGEYLYEANDKVKKNYAIAQREFDERKRKHFARQKIAKKRVVSSICDIVTQKLNPPIIWDKIVVEIGRKNGPMVCQNITFYCSGKQLFFMQNPEEIISSNKLNLSCLMALKNNFRYNNWLILTIYYGGDCSYETGRDM